LLDDGDDAAAAADVAAVSEEPEAVAAADDEAAGPSGAIMMSITTSSVVLESRELSGMSSSPVSRSSPGTYSPNEKLTRGNCRCESEMASSANTRRPAGRDRSLAGEPDDDDDESKAPCGGHEAETEIVGFDDEEVLDVTMVGIEFEVSDDVVGMAVAAAAAVAAVASSLEISRESASAAMRSELSTVLLESSVSESESPELRDR